MKLKDYIDNLQKLAKERPELLELDVVYARDSEGNGFSTVGYTPTVGYFSEHDFVSEEGFEDYEIEEPANAVCVN